MKKTILSLLIFLMLVLSSCNVQNTTTRSLDTSRAATQIVANVEQGLTGAMPVASVAQNAAEAASTVVRSASAVNLNEFQLLFGTIKLAGTNNAITKEQATTLLPLWNNFKTLSMSLAPAQRAAGQGQSGSTTQSQTTNTDTQTQIATFIQQILVVMTPAQIHAIAEMNITQDTVMTLMQELGLSMGGPQQGAAPNGGQQPPQGNPPSGGQQPQGTLQVGGAGAPPAGKNGAGTPPSDGGMIPPEMFDALIQSLNSISGVRPSPAANSTTGNSTGMQPPAGSSSSDYTITATYEQDGGSVTKDGQTYGAANQDQSAVYVKNAGTLTVTNATITTTGNTSSQDNSSFHGLNAAVLAASGSTINLSDSSITTTGTGANGAFATDSGSTVNLTDITIQVSADGAHAVMATNSGVMTLTNVDMNTTGGSSSAIATDRGGGTITVTGGTVTTSGMNSADIYSTGVISVSGATLSASGAEAAVIEGANSITLTNTSLSTSKEKWGGLIYQSMSGDAQGTQGTFTMTGGALNYTAASGPLFYVTNSTGIITLKGVNITNASRTLLNASAGNWGNTGSNGGTVNFTADGQSLSGNITADNISTITLALKNDSVLTGAIDIDHTAKAVNLILDASSSWNVTADSYLTCLTNPDGISGTSINNINGSSHTVYYDSSACSVLGGQTYALNGGGVLKPAG